MYTIKVDGQLLYSPELLDAGYRVLNPTLHLEVNMAGSLSFLLPHDNVMYDAIHKMKSIITVEQDGEIIFRGRVLEEITDMYKQKNVYCEGELSFLLDSMQAPCKYNGKAAEVFAQLIERHNGQVDEEKRFALGVITAVDDADTIDYEVKGYNDTSSTLETLMLNVFGGYLRTRHENGLHYLDYVDTFRDESTQKIEFGVNMLNIENQVNAQEVCTVLIPLGKADSDGQQLTIANVNGGIPYIENPAGIALYGRICKTQTWNHVTDPSELLKLGNEYLKSMALTETLTIHAVDLHLLDVDTEAIREGSKVHLLSAPHGLDRKSICSAMDIYLQSGDMSSYTFGLPKRTLTTLESETKKQVQSVSGTTDDQHEIIDKIQQTQTEQKEYNDTALDDIRKRLSQAETDIDSAEDRLDDAETSLETKASQTSVNELSGRMTNAEGRLTDAEGRLDDVETSLEAKASQSSVNDLGERLTNAEERLTDAEDRLDDAETSLETKASQSSVNALSGRMTDAESRLTDAEGRLDDVETSLEAKASQTSVNELSGRMTNAEVRLTDAEGRLDDVEDRLTDTEGRLDDTEGRLTDAESAISTKANQSSVNALDQELNNIEIKIDDANAEILLKASKEELSELGEKVSNAEIRINGAEALIDMKANQAEVTDLSTRLSGAEIRINGAEAAIEMKAAQGEVTAISERLTTAEVKIDGANAVIEQKASKTEVTELGTRLSGAEIRINGAEAAIEMKAGQGTVDELGERVSTAEVRIDGMDSTITAKADKVKVEALETEISGLLKTDELESKIASLGSLHVGGDVNVPGTVTADNLWVNGVATLDGGIDTSNIDCTGLSVDGSGATWKSTYILTGIGTVKQSKRFLNVMLADGTTTQIDVVTDVSIEPSRSFIEYLGKN